MAINLDDEAQMRSKGDSRTGKSNPETSIMLWISEKKKEKKKTQTRI